MVGDCFDSKILNVLPKVIDSIYNCLFFCDLDLFLAKAIFFLMGQKIGRRTNHLGLKLVLVYRGHDVVSDVLRTVCFFAANRNESYLGPLVLKNLILDEPIATSSEACVRRKSLVK